MRLPAGPYTARSGTLRLSKLTAHTCPLGRDGIPYDLHTLCQEADQNRRLPKQFPAGDGLPSRSLQREMGYQTLVRGETNPTVDVDDECSAVPARIRSFVRRLLAANIQCRRANGAEPEYSRRATQTLRMQFCTRHLWLNRAPLDPNHSELLT